MDRREERQFIQAAQRGKRNAFGRLYQAHVQTIYRYIYARVADAPLAEDLTGDVFAKAYAAIGQYHDEGKPFIAWLYRIAHARVVDYYRRQQRRPQAEAIAEDVPAAETNWDASLLQQQAAAWLQQSMATLTEEQQHCLILRFVNGYSLEEVAQVMGKNANAIKALQHRAVKALAARLNDAGIDIEQLLSGLS